MIVDYIRLAKKVIADVPSSDHTYKYQHVFTVVNIIDTLSDDSNLLQLSMQCQMADYLLHDYYKSSLASEEMDDDLRADMNILSSSIDVNYVKYFNKYVKVVQSHYQEILTL